MCVHNFHIQCTDELLKTFFNVLFADNISLNVTFNFHGDALSKMLPCRHHLVKIITGLGPTVKIFRLDMNMFEANGWAPIKLTNLQ